MTENTLEIRELFEVFKNKKWILVSVTVVITLIGVWYSMGMHTTYRASTKVYVGNSENIVNNYTEDQMKYYSNFLNTFKEIIMIDDFLDETLKTHGIELSSAQVKSGLGFVSATNSPIVEISYIANNPEIAQDVLQALTDEYTDQVESIMSNAKVKVVDSVKVSEIQPAKVRIFFISFFVGVIAAIGIIIIVDYFDNRIYTRSTLERVLPIPVLGELPHFKDKEEK